MAVTPLDILQKQFRPATRGGLDPEDVTRFVDGVRESLEASLAEAARLREDLRARDELIQQLREDQLEIQETLVLARRMSQELESAGRREADLLIGEARLDAERILSAAHEEERTLHASVVRLRAARFHQLAQMRALLEAQQRLLDESERIQ